MIRNEQTRASPLARSSHAPDLPARSHRVFLKWCTHVHLGKEVLERSKGLLDGELVGRSNELELLCLVLRPEEDTDNGTETNGDEDDEHEVSPVQTRKEEARRQRVSGRDEEQRERRTRLLHSPLVGNKAIDDLGGDEAVDNVRHGHDTGSEESRRTREESQLKASRKEKSSRDQTHPLMSPRHRRVVASATMMVVRRSRPEYPME